VLEDGTRVINQSSFLKALGRSIRPAAGQGSTTLSRAMEEEWGSEEPPPFLPSKNLKPFITRELMASKNPISYKPVSGGSMAFGYKAEILPMVCYAYVDADKAGVILPSQRHMVLAAEAIIRGLATVGIIALIDEATGYQEVRDRLALQRILDAFISRELAKWAKRFPDDFYREMFRLKNWEWRGMRINRPAVVGHYTNDLVYDRLAPGVLEELRRLNPPDEAGHRKHKHHQWLTPDVGHPKLRDHLSGIIALMRAASAWEQFKRLVDKAYPKMNTTMALPFREDV
jgi:hypothetical protein